MSPRIESYDHTGAGFDIQKTATGYNIYFDGTCIAKFKSDGDLILKGIIETENENPCSA